MNGLVLLLLRLYLITTVVVHCDDTENATATANQQAQTDLLLIDTLSYNKSGNIYSLSWSASVRSQAASNVTQEEYQSYYSYLVAASVSSFQVWNGTTTTINKNIKNNLSSAAAAAELQVATKWDLEQLIPNNIVARAVSFSPNGKWLALGDDSGIIQIWSIAPQQPSKLVLSAQSNVDGKIRSLAWHSSSLFLGAAGTKFVFVVLDGNRNWTRTYAEPRSSTIRPPPADTYVHYMDWSPTNEFVVDTSIYEVHQQSNVFDIGSISTTPIMSRAIEVLDACRLCTLSQWSPDGQFIATAFGNEIRILQKKSIVATNHNSTTTGRAARWESIYNLTTVNETYMIIMALEWSPDGRYLAAGGAGNFSLFVYDTSKWSNMPLVVPTATQYGIDALAWRPDSQQIAIGTSRVVEIREIRFKEVPASSAITYFPSSAPSDGSIQLMSDSPSTLSPVQTGISVAGMAGIGISAVILSISCVAFVFLQRLKLISNRKATKEKNRIEDDDDKVYREVEDTMSDEEYDCCPSPLDRIISIPRKIDDNTTGSNFE